MTTLTHTLPGTHIARSSRSRPIQIVVTPGSGNGQAMPIALALRDALCARGQRSSLEVFPDLDRLRGWATTGGDRASLLICVGGDGTQSTAALAAVRRSVPFLPVSCGFGEDCGPGAPSAGVGGATPLDVLAVRPLTGAPSRSAVGRVRGEDVPKTGRLGIRGTRDALTRYERTPVRRAETEVTRVLADLGSVAVRAALEVVFIGHGAQKAFVAFGALGHL